jgi:hypothetical protein
VLAVLAAPELAGPELAVRMMELTGKILFLIL